MEQLSTAQALELLAAVVACPRCKELTSAEELAPCNNCGWATCSNCHCACYEAHLSLHPATARRFYDLLDAGIPSDTTEAAAWEEELERLGDALQHGGFDVP